MTGPIASPDVSTANEDGVAPFTSKRSVPSASEDDPEVVSCAELIQLLRQPPIVPIGASLPHGHGMQAY